MIRRVLITGGTGLLGKTLLESAPAGWDIIGTWHRTQPPVEWRGRFMRLSLDNPEGVFATIVALEPDVVIHTAGPGHVDQAQRDPQAARRLIVGGAQQIAAACRRANARLVHLSSNAVFDGESPPYAETAPLRAVNAYGQLKIDAERAVKGAVPEAIIIRPILMYGWPWPGGRDNAVTRWLARLQAGLPIEAAQDVISMPLAVTDAAEAIWATVHRERAGIYHLAGAERVTLADFAWTVAHVFGCDRRLVHRVRSAQLPGLAPRPKDTSFVLTKMRQELGVEPLGIQAGLSAMAQQRVAA